MPLTLQTSKATCPPHEGYGQFIQEIKVRLTVLRIETEKRYAAYTLKRKELHCKIGDERSASKHLGGIEVLLSVRIWPFSTIKD